MHADLQIDTKACEVDGLKFTIFFFENTTREIFILKKKNLITGK